RPAAAGGRRRPPGRGAYGLGAPPVGRPERGGTGRRSEGGTRACGVAPHARPLRVALSPAGRWQQARYDMESRDRPRNAQEDGIRGTDQYGDFETVAFSSSGHPVADSCRSVRPRNGIRSPNMSSALLRAIPAALVALALTKPAVSCTLALPATR